MSTPRLGYLVFVSAMLVGPSAFASQRTFKAALEKVPACSLANPSGTATIQIDDVSGAVTGTITLSGFEGGATVAHAGIHNKDAGDNHVGPCTGVNGSAPNGSHTVTTQLNSIALPKILGGSGAIIVSSSATGCTFGAVRGNLVEDGPAPDAGTSTPDASAGEPPPSTPDASAGANTGANEAPANEPAASTDSVDDGGCSQSSTRTTGRSGLVLIGLAIAAALRARRAARR